LPAISAVTPDPASISAGAATNITCSASDPDGDALSYSWSAASGTLSSTTGNPASWTAPSQSGTYTVSVTVSDGYGGSVQCSTSIIVLSDGLPFYDDFLDSNLTQNWVLSGTPNPVWVSSAFGRNAVFDNNGNS